MNQITDLKQYLLVGLTLLGAFVLFIVFLQTESLYISIGLLVGVSALIYVFNEFFNQLKVKLYDAFRDRIVFTSILVAFFVFIFPFLMKSDPYWIYTLTLGCLWVMVVLGINLQFGSAGVINLGGALFYGVGGYTTAILTMRYAVHPLIGILIGGIIAAAVGSILFVPILKSKGHYQALVSLSAVVAFGLLAVNIEWLGGSQGINGVTSITLGGFSFTMSRLHILGFELSSYANFYYFTAIIAGITWVLTYRMWNSWAGLALNSFNENKGDEVAAGCMGIRRTIWIPIVFSIGNFFAGISGALYTHINSYIAPSDVTLYKSLLFLSAVIIGGMDSIFGVTFAAVLLVILPEKFRVLQQSWVIAFMGAILAILIFRPEGLIPARIRKYGFKNVDKLLEWVNQGPDEKLKEDQNE